MVSGNSEYVMQDSRAGNVASVVWYVYFTVSPPVGIAISLRLHSQIDRARIWKLEKYLEPQFDAFLSLQGRNLKDDYFSLQQ